MLLQQGVDCIPALVQQLKMPAQANRIDVDSLMGDIKRAALGLEEVIVLNDSVKLSKPEPQQTASELEDSRPGGEFQDELTGIFSAEATQHIKVMRDAVGENYQSSNVIRMDEELLRTVHTMCGSARTAGVQNIADLCHPLEEIIAVAIKHNINFSDGQTQLVQSCVKQIESDLGKIEQSEQIVDLDSTLLNRLHVLNEELISQYSKHDAEAQIVEQLQQPKDASMADCSDDGGEELCEIFFEEAEDVLAECQRSLQKLKTKQDGQGAISELQRQCHTLKGSSLMVGFSAISELSHATESLLVSLSDGSVDDEISTPLLQRVLDTLHANIEIAQRGENVYLDDSLLAELQTANGIQKNMNTHQLAPMYQRLLEMLMLVLAKLSRSLNLAWRIESKIKW